MVYGIEVDYLIIVTGYHDSAINKTIIGVIKPDLNSNLFSKMSVEVRKLAAGEGEVWRSIRLEAIREEPLAFGGDYEEESMDPLSSFEDSVVANSIFVATVDKIVVGCAGFFALKGKKLRHIGKIFSVYVSSHYRGLKIASQLFDAIVNHARTVDVLQLELSVRVSNPAAVGLYQRLGFSIFGTEPRAMRVGDEFIDEYLMIRIL